MHLPPAESGFAKALSDRGVLMVLAPVPPDAGPACGAGYVFFLADGFTMPTLQADINALLTALNTDRASLDEVQNVAGPSTA